MFCREQSIETGGYSGGAAMPVKCRSWMCPECCEMRRRQLMARCAAGKPNRFITITCRRGQFPTPEQAALALARAWRTVVQHWRRKAKWHKCEYLCVFEPHVSGWPHLHILWRGHWIQFAWLRDEMSKLINSPHVHISLIKDEKSAVAYVAKYFGKAPTRFGTAKRYWTSGNYAPSSLTDAQRAFPKAWKWELTDQTIQKIKQTWEWKGRTVFDLTPNIIAWGWMMDTPLKRSTEPIKRLRYKSGLLQYFSDAGITPIGGETVA